MQKVIVLDLLCYHLDVDHIFLHFFPNQFCNPTSCTTNIGLIYCHEQQWFKPIIIWNCTQPYIYNGCNLCNQNPLKIYVEFFGSVFPKPPIWKAHQLQKLAKSHIFAEDFDFNPRIKMKSWPCLQVNHGYYLNKWYIWHKENLCQIA